MELTSLVAICTKLMLIKEIRTFQNSILNRKKGMLKIGKEKVLFFEIIFANKKTNIYLRIKKLINLIKNKKSLLIIT